MDDRWGDPPPAEPRPAAILKGGARGLEILVDGAAAVGAISDALTRRLEEAPGFFRGSSVRVRVDGVLPAGALGRIDEIAARFELTIVEVGPRKSGRSIGSARRGGAEASAPVPTPALAVGSAPEALPALPGEAAPAAEVAPAEAPAVAAEVAPGEAVCAEAAAVEPAPAEAAAPTEAATAPAEAAAPTDAALVGLVALALAQAQAAATPAPEKTRMVVGPVQPGVILDHPGHLVVVGDVNPGAEVRAEGNIVILGRLRGIAHAGIGRERGFILALRLEPQQLRIGRVVARSSDQEAASTGTEIAHLTDKTIVVERYAGKLPPGLAAGI